MLIGIGIANAIILSVWMYVSAAILETPAWRLAQEGILLLTLVGAIPGYIEWRDWRRSATQLVLRENGLTVTVRGSEVEIPFDQLREATVTGTRKGGATLHLKDGRKFLLGPGFDVDGGAWRGLLGHLQRWAHAAGNCQIEVQKWSSFRVPAGRIRIVEGRST